MFRELMNYCVTMVTYSAVYSLALQHTTTISYIILLLWSGNVFHRVCLGSSPRGMLLPRKVLSLVSSFLSLFEIPPSCLTLIGVGEKLDDCLTSSLPGSKRPSIVNPFGPRGLETSLALPTAQIIERHDFRTIRDFLLMKLRTALDKDWLQNLPILHKVLYFLLTSVIETLNFRYLILVYSSVYSD